MDEWARWAVIGGRLKDARLAEGMTQAQMSERSGIERTALAKIESGLRHVDAIELLALSTALDLPLSYLLSEPLAAIVSRRSALDEDATKQSRSRHRLDAQLEVFARDTEWLVRARCLTPPPALALGDAQDREAAREIARRARSARGLGPGTPLGGMAEVSEQFGLYLTSRDIDAEGASISMDVSWGVAVVGSLAAPGRRRFSAAHELGHHLLGDAYSSDFGRSASDERGREAIIDAFAAEFLLPSTELAAVLKTTRSVDEDGLRTRLIELAARFRVSWSVITHAADLIDPSSDRIASAMAAVPTRGDFLAAAGEEPPEDLHPGALSPTWRKAVASAYLERKITTDRALELLPGLSEDDLPKRRSVVEPA